MYAAASGSGYGCEQGVPTEAALLATLAAFAVSFGILYMASTTNTGRKKRDADLNIGDILKDVMWKGKNNFRIANFKKRILKLLCHNFRS